VSCALRRGRRWAAVLRKERLLLRRVAGLEEIEKVDTRYELHLRSRDIRQYMCLDVFGDYFRLQATLFH
jgi:hypothetical protein